MQVNQQNQQNNVGPNTYTMLNQATTHDVSQNNLQPHNDERNASYHRQLAQNQAMALAQLSVPKEPEQKYSIQHMPYDDLSNNINYAIEHDFVSSSDLHQQPQNISSSSTQSAVSNLVNQKPPVYTKWTEQEDELLRSAVRRWTSQEDNALKEAVSHYINSVDSQGNPQPIPWNKVSKRIPQRTGAQCQARWTEALDPRIRKGKWSPSEDEILKEGVRMFGRCWIRIAEMIDGRTQRQCRTRWLQIKNKQSRIKNDESGITTINSVNNSNDDNNGTMLILTPPHTTPSTPSQRIKNVSSNSPEVMQGMQGVILRSSQQMINTDNSAFATLTSPVSNSGKSPTISDSETPISSPEFHSNYAIPLVDTNSYNFNNCNLYGAYQSPYIEDYHNQVAYIF
ncbi:Bas1p [Rhizophagus irregularis DAOM 197198w]|uniref:Bas1p n=1 Tax=Rhizophagus irregularis (strain DAOM 197198w) TaxID=1432141 RepID=A0A015KFK1_RHIIW|nr:Bas1p [Rhizophagus irregularis DAOM 197198w]